MGMGLMLPIRWGVTYKNEIIDYEKSFYLFIFPKGENGNDESEDIVNIVVNKCQQSDGVCHL